MVVVQLYVFVHSHCIPTQHALLPTLHFPLHTPSQAISLRDLKLENILLRGSPTKPIVKLCDMGFSKSDVLHSAPDSTVGTLAYTAPEVCVWVDAWGIWAECIMWVGCTRICELIVMHEYCMSIMENRVYTYMSLIMCTYEFASPHLPTSSSPPHPLLTSTLTKIITGKVYDGKQTDAWALGVLLFVLMAGAYPFERSADKQLHPTKRQRMQMQRIIKVCVVCFV